MTSKSFKQQVQSLVSNSRDFAKLEQYVALIETKNQLMNLTGFSGDRLWGEGILESILLMKTGLTSKGDTSEKLYFLDIGSGVGFPSLPYLISFGKHHHFTIYEPSTKRVDFLNLVKEELHLENLTIVQTRAEEVLKFEIFDFITARAVSELKNLVKISHHLAKIGCLFSFIKGPKYKDEIIAAKIALKEFEPIHFDILPVNIEGLSKTNYLVQFVKTQKTPPKYPVKWAQIIK